MQTHGTFARIAVALVLAIVMGATCSRGSAQDGMPTYAAPRVSGAIVVDGELDAVWAKAPLI
ncbi:MAG: hypothetical protein KIT83_17570, partial [Bryobacterales bacterium]|nr:hypothetical protein [Bryobacterales bacterium]